MQNTLDKLVEPWLVKMPKQVIKGIGLDSRTIQPGDCFVAILGHHVDGRHYIDTAIRKGAVAILFEHPHPRFIQDENGICHLGLPKLQQKLSEIAGRFYQYPSQHMPVVGVTGTNGKSTVTHMLASWFSAHHPSQQKTAVIGTLGCGFLQELQPTQNTTPDALSLQKDLAYFYSQGCPFTAMEVSSHSVVQGRVRCIDFSAGVFTNLTRDHLDYHGSMEAYAQAKHQFLQQIPEQRRVINADDPYGRKWLATDCQHALAYGFGQTPAQHLGPHILCENLQQGPDFLAMDLRSSWGRARLQLPFVGAFNAANALAALGTLLLMGYPLPKLAQCSQQLLSVPGRMQVLKQPNKPIVIVDYAHTPDALQQALRALRVGCKGKLWCLIGCGGDRDQGKRALMGHIAWTQADHVILTDDNPRSEPPESIITMMLSDITDTTQVQIIHDRRQAIATAIAQAQAQDTILIAGKGHECEQIIGQQYIQHCDVDVARNYLREPYD